MRHLYIAYIKRFLGFVLALAGILVLALVMAVIAVWIRVDSEGPVFFRQKRIGAGESEFMILKFRTMHTDAPKDMPTHLLEDPDAMITRAGRFLRKSSLDELPQLFNILKGEMSIVGPRPALWNQYDLIEARRQQVCGGKSVNDLRPGITGWAQVNGRDELPIDVKAAYDGEYLRRAGFFFDLKCLLLTVKTVVCREGFAEGKQTGEPEKDK